MIVSTSHRVCTMKNIDFTDFFNVFLSGATIKVQPFFNPYISMKLDENERSTQTRLMKVKDMMLEQTHHYREKNEEKYAAG